MIFNSCEVRWNIKNLENSKKRFNLGEMSLCEMKFNRWEMANLILHVFVNIMLISSLHFVGATSAIYTKIRFAM